MAGSDVLHVAWKGGVVVELDEEGIGVPYQCRRL
jgi:hypothetical protein